MQVVKVYVANDGTKFDTEQDCLKYENSIANVEKYKGISALWNESPASSVASFVMNYFDKIKVIMEPEAKAVIIEKVTSEVDWSTIPEGTRILVRDHENDPWDIREFLYIDTGNKWGMNIVCRNSYDNTSNVSWTYAKLITD